MRGSWEQIGEFGFLDRRIMFRVSVVGFLAELAFALTTALPSPPSLPVAFVAPLFAGVFIVHLRSVVVLMQRGEGRISWRFLRELVSPVPVLVWVAFIVLYAVAWKITGTSLGHLRGDPTERDGGYFLNDHGSYLPVSHSEYLKAQAQQLRIFTLGPSVFYALGVILNWPGQPEGSTSTRTASLSS